MIIFHEGKTKEGRLVKGVLIVADKKVREGVWRTHFYIGIGFKYDRFLNKIYLDELVEVERNSIKEIKVMEKE